MTSTFDVAELRAVTGQPDLAQLAAAARLAKQGDAASRLQIIAAQCWVAFAAPVAITPVYDAIAAGWLDAPEPVAPLPAAVPEAPVPNALWEAVVAVVNDAEQGFDAGTITARVAALGASAAPEFGELAEQAARLHPGANDPETQTAPPLLSVPDLADTPDGSLAQALYRMLVDNGYDAEVLDREVIGLSELPPALSYLNTRILQMHDVWHLAAGYETTALHEVAISGFQLAQFGHNYSAMFLATVSVISASRSPDGFGLLLQTVAEAWQHGRACPSFMAIEWEACWQQSIETIREQRGIPAFKGSFPPDLLEQLSPQAA